jgi:uncharacterized membrane protein YbhN (UPF0104 family)
VLVLVPGDLERRAAAASKRSGGMGRFAARLATVPQVAGNGTRLAIQLARGNPAIFLGPFLWWAFDVGALWACFEAFGTPPSIGIIVLCYFLGMLGNLLPVPGGVAALKAAWSARSWPPAWAPSSRSSRSSATR